MRIVKPSEWRGEWLVQDAAIESGRDGGRTVVDAELLQDVLDEPLRRRAADVQLPGDFVVGQAALQQAEDLDFAWRQMRADRVLVHAPRGIGGESAKAGVHSAH